jgi:hypothetical protein
LEKHGVLLVMTKCSRGRVLSLDISIHFPRHSRAGALLSGIILLTSSCE